MKYICFSVTDTQPDVVDGVLVQDAGGEALPAIVGYLQRVPTDGTGGPIQAVIALDGPIDLDHVAEVVKM